jgi:DNA repair protein RadC
MKLTSPRRVYRFFKPRMDRADVEEFWAAALNSEKAILAAQCLFRGTVDSCFFHPRDVFRFACRHNASALVVAHNHPSGNPAPSDEDLQVTKRLVFAGAIMQMPVVDHVILGTADYFSFAQAGWLPEAPKDLVWPDGRSPD